MAKASKITKAELKALVGKLIDTSTVYDRETRDKDRDKALKYFRGEVEFPPMGQDGSKFVSRDVSDVHGQVMPGLMRVFFSSDRLVTYEPTRPKIERRSSIDPATGQPVATEVDVSDDEANQATDLVNYIVLKECSGFRHFRSAFSDGLLLGNGILKHWWDDTPEHRTDSYSGLDDAALNMVLSNEDIVEDGTEIESKIDTSRIPEVLAQMEAAGLPVPEQLPENLDVSDEVIAQLEAAGIHVPKLHEATVKTIISSGRLCLEAMPGEEFLIDSTAKVLDEDCRFCAHRQRKTRSELIKAGYRRDDVDKLPEFDIKEDEERANDSGYGASLAPDISTQYVEVYECYVLVDYDGDGIAERRRVVLAGASGSQVMLENEEWGDDLPFSDIAPDPIPHQWVGRDLYDLVGDAQRYKTVSIRGVLDNTYQQLAPQTEIEEGAYVNEDELYNPTKNGVLVRKANKPPANVLNKPYIADKIMPMVSFMDGVVEARTGISGRSTALDVDALQNQSATAVNAAVSAAYTQTEEYARNIAEYGGMRRVFNCLYRLIVKHQDRKKTIRLRGKWVNIDPTGWSADMDVTVNIGLGTGSRDRDLQMLGVVSQRQEQAMMALGGPDNPILGADKIMQTYQKMAEVSGIRNPENFFPDISPEDMQKRRAAAGSQAQQNPALLKVQAEIEADKQKALAKFEMDRMAQEHDHRLAQNKAALDLDLERQKAEADLQIERMKAQGMLDLKRQELELEAALTARANQARFYQGSPTPPDVNINSVT